MTEIQIRKFLETFKTMPCEKTVHHDHRLCPQYHEYAKDGRRNPYTQKYDKDESLNQMEKLYHPVLFRTTLCRNVSSCQFQSCCARAHREADIRDREEATVEYENFHQQKNQRPELSLSSFIPERQNSQKRDYVMECHEIWKQVKVTPKTVLLRLNEAEAFLVRQSPTLFTHLQDIAMEEGLCCIAKETCSHKLGLLVKGLNAELATRSIRDCLQPPSRHFARCEQKYPKRVIHSIKQWLDDPTAIYAQVVTDDSKIRFYGVNSKSRSGADNIKLTMEKIKFWIEQEGHDRFLTSTCGCCFDEYNLDQGIQCAEGHFYCSGSSDSCFSMAIKAQINQIRTSEVGLVCPVCNTPYSQKDIAAHLPESVWERVQDAIVAKMVEKEKEALDDRFNQILNSKIQELLSQYDNADDIVKLRAQQEALKVKNTIMNLSCPHCGIAYSEFTGCMALQCATCKGNFCGYCHSKTTTSRGAHDHVRECLMNETNNGSYYATSEEIEKAQKRYRTREIKKVLRNHKKDLQNAIVIELGPDLKDIGIEPDALFEVGTLHDQVYDDFVNIEL